MHAYELPNDYDKKESSLQLFYK